MKGRARPPIQRDVRAGLVCAEAFQRLAEPFLSKITAIKEGTQEPSRGLGDLVASAANLSFALELYIKTLLDQLQLSVPQDHHLRHLYDALPEDVKAEVEKGYGSAWRARWYGKRAAFTIAKGPQAEPNWSDYRDESKHLAALLERSAKVFKEFRYIYEFHRSGERRLPVPSVRVRPSPLRLRGATGSHPPAVAATAIRAVGAS